MIEQIRKLTVSGPEVDRVIELPEGVILIGRQPGVDLFLPDKLVSRQHARVECGAEQCQITDLESSNGTRLNGEAIPPGVPATLEDGTLIEIGPYRLVFEVMEIEVPTIAEEGAAEHAAAEATQEGETADIEPSIEPALTGGGQTPPNGGPPAGLISPGSFEPPPGLDIHSRRLISYLPGIFQNDFMQRFMGIFEAILTPIEWNIDNFDLFLDPGTAPSDFMPWLANWFVLTFDSTWSEAQRRQLMAEAHQIYARRGTPWALSRILEIYTGEQPRIDDQSQELEPHTFQVTLPVASGLVNVDLVKALINASKPAHTSYSLHFSDDK
jgi:phage tail-like protein